MSIRPRGPLEDFLARSAARIRHALSRLLGPRRLQATTLDTRYLLAQVDSIHLNATRLLPRTEVTSQRLNELVTASSSPALWTAYLTVLDYRSYNWRSPNDVFDPRTRPPSFMDAIARNARELALEASPEQLVLGLVGAFEESRIVLSTADFECIEECYKRYGSRSDDLLTCLANCVG